MFHNITSTLWISTCNFQQGFLLAVCSFAAKESRSPINCCLNFASNRLTMFVLQWHRATAWTIWRHSGRRDPSTRCHAVIGQCFEAWDKEWMCCVSCANWYTGYAVMVVDKVAFHTLVRTTNFRNFTQNIVFLRITFSAYYPFVWCLMRVLLGWGSSFAKILRNT